MPLALVSLLVAHWCRLCASGWQPYHLPMLDLVILLIASAAGMALLWPPRRDEGRWLATTMALLWVAIVAVGLRRGIVAGMLPWLLVLAIVGALAALMVLWSLVAALTRGR